ncbi:hypothetical protein C3B59_07060 [Cryobacterium zongtaii]|uniref:M23ase beta-sheet core domain-containing protein n=1 Tax=Cryobacterium zongtaii TaxID=1259217 RepID=A0A2S3ZHZ7_9MICO|nr:M23 family metallopeptidase [Cryobacterium zongtaii]POH67069.1 hypothetical protein C3B59_07060 [Cryobacterium zongtaii]
MTSILNNFAFPVISDDNRDPYVSWQHHLDRGSAGGVDLAYPSGSAVRANANGVVANVSWFGSGGHTARLQLDDGRYIEYMHLASFSVSNGQSVSSGTQIGVSGASGQGDLNYYAPHLHVHMYIGSTRVNIYDHFTTTRPREEDAKMAQYYLRSTTGQIGRFGGGVTVFGTLDAYNKHRTVVGLWNAANPNFKQVTPPPATAGSIIGLDDYGWSVQVAAHGGIVG